ncbi:MAG: RDD family protein [Acidobacteriota bacterium]
MSARQEEARTSYGRDASLRASTARSESNQRPESPATPTRRSSNNIVEAALTRVKRASENASRAALPKIEPARSVQASSQVSLAGDRQATARALAPEPEIESRVEFTPAPRPEFIQPPIIKSARVEASFPEKRRPETTVIADLTDSQTSPAGETVERASVLILDEIEPLDYLEAEVRKVDKALGAEFLRNESPSILTHAVIDLVDLLAVAVSCSPFLAFIIIADGSFSIAKTRLASGAIVALIAFFYLALTQCLCGRTFGMMLTNTRVVDARSFEAPSPSQALFRTAGYFLAAAPAMAGILWAAFDRKHRGWQDFISGTVVVRDF